MSALQSLFRKPLILLAFSFGYCAVFCAIFCCTSASIHAAATADQRKQFSEIESSISAAGRLYSAKKYVESAEKLRQAQSSLIKMLDTKDVAVQKLVKPLFSRLERAHALLELEGAELEELPTWEKLTLEAPTAGSAPSFKNDVAPWLVSQCGNCHINSRRGQFSMASFNELMQGINGRKVVNPGGAKGSRIVEVIESGDMPRGGGKVSDENFTKLQKWIDAGAKFDGPDPMAMLSSYAKADPSSPSMPEPAVVRAPTGKESVRFSLDIAPLLVENCNGCHINGRRASGGFRMDNFTSMLRGGDSGSAIVAGQPEESLLIKKLKGLSGDRMPKGRPALSDEKIKLFSKWIQEGATFDGSSPSMDIEDVLNQAWAAVASHKELFERRAERARALWKKVLPNSEPSIAKNDELIVLGNVTPTRAEEWLAAGGAAMADVHKQLRLPGGNAIKGGVAIFVYKSRYDYAEFGRMNEKRTLPGSWQAHWRASPLDIYVALVDDTALDAKQQLGVLTQQLSGALVGSLPQAPNWFSEGVARNVAVATAVRGDSRVAQWKRNLPTAAAMVDKSDTLLKGELDDEASGLIGMKLVGVMMDSKNRKRFDALLGQMRSGVAFPDAMAHTFAPPEKFVKSWVGK